MIHGATIKITVCRGFSVCQTMISICVKFWWWYMSHLRLCSFWTAQVFWGFETNTLVKKNNEQSSTAGDRIGACLKLRHTQLGPTCDTQSYCQYRAFFTLIWPCIVTNFFVIKPHRCSNFTNLFCHETLHVSDSSYVHHQEFIHCTLSNGVCHTGL